MQKRNLSRRKFIRNSTTGICGAFFLKSWTVQARGREKQEHLVWIEALDFTEYGGWKLDTQFMDLMGSVYLLAAGTGDPVRDASTVVEIPDPGKYTLWVRCKNWLPEYAPGRFSIAINDHLIDHTFGREPSGKWTWEKAGTHDIPAGVLKITLKDLTGHYGRCSSLVLTTDPDYALPLEAESIRRERSRMKRIGVEPEDSGTYDVIVTGAGAAGCCAALAAARAGARTALIDCRDEPGGNFYLGVPLNGATILHKNARETGIVEEISRIKSYHRLSGPEVLRKLIGEEPNLSLFLNQFVIDVEMAGRNQITGVQTIGTKAYRRFSYRGKVIIDCSGDGWTGSFAGAESRYGRESKHEFGESLAPEKADEITMSGVLFKEAFIYKAADRGSDSPYSPPEWAYQFPSGEKFHRMVGDFTYGSWWHEHRGTVNDLWEPETARDDLLRITYGYWDYVKNYWKDRAKTRNYALQTVATTLAKRETRRLVGDHILTQNNVQNNELFRDRVSYGGWPIDVHHPEGIFSGKDGPYEYNAHAPVYQIPFRCLYSKNIENLMFAGRDISVTHVALGTVRVQRTLACLGQVTGIAAAMCLKEKIYPRELGSKHIEALQQECLKRDLYIPEITSQDSRDLARTCDVSASSINHAVSFGKINWAQGAYLPLDRQRAVVFPRGLNEHLDAIYIRLNSINTEAATITLSLYEHDNESLIVVHEATVPPDHSAYYFEQQKYGTAHWVKFEVGQEIRARNLLLTMTPAEGIFWPLMLEAPVKALRAERNDPSGDWMLFTDECHAFYTDPEIILPGIVGQPSFFQPENVTNGVTRIIGNSPNMWASDPYRELPQWIELDFGKKQMFNKVHVCFDTNLDTNDSHLYDFRPAECVRDYSLSYYDGGGWKEIREVRDNILRHRIHHFQPLEGSKFRLTVLSTHGERSARIYEIRVYLEEGLI